MSLLKPVCNAEFFSKEYFERAIKECPKLATLSGGPMNDYMLTVLAFNLSYNAFYRGKHKTAIKLLRSVFNSKDLSEQVYISAALLEAQMCCEFNRIKLAQHLLIQLSRSSSWEKATTEQKDCFELLTARCKNRAMLPVGLESNALHWFLLDCETQLKFGDSRSGLNALFKRRKGATGNERRLLDNAIGCVFAFYIKDCNMAESYFRSAMLEDKNWKTGICTPISSSALVYHTALAQLGSGKPKTAGYLFLCVLPFFCDNPRIYLRIAECCVHNKSTEAMQADVKDNLEKFAFESWNLMTNLQRNKCFKMPDTINCNIEFAAYIIHQGLTIALTQKDFAYLLPYLYSLYAFVNIRLRRYTEAIKASNDLLALQQINPRQKLMAMFYKAETFIYTNRIPEAIACLQQTTPLQSVTYTFSRIIYNRALLEALNGNFEQSLEILNELNNSANMFVQRAEVNLLRMYLDMRLRRIKMAKQVFKTASTLNFTIS